MIVNRFTKYVIFISVRKNWKIKNLANALINNVFKYFDMFVSIVNDRKSLFILHFLSAFCYHVSMSLRYNIVFHFQTNEQTKRQNQILEQYLKCYVNYSQNNWATLLWIAIYTYNNAWHSIINISSQQVMFETNVNWTEFLKKRENFEISAARFRVQIITNLRSYLCNRLKKRKLYKLNIMMPSTYLYDLI